jgi:hypothetical protein
VTHDNPELPAHESVEPPFTSRHRDGNTFIPFYFQPQAYKDKSLAELVNDLLKRLAEFTRTRRDYYDGRRAAVSWWVFGSRTVLAIAGSLGIFLTAVAAALQLTKQPEESGTVLFIILVLYALMGAVAFYERVTDKASSYFRHVVAILSIRDLWTKLQFEVLKELEKLRKATDVATAEAAARDQIIALVEAYCTDLDKITTTEAMEWRTEFQTSMGELEEAARKGSEDVIKRIEDYAKAAEKAAADAKAAAEALKPGYLNLKVNGDFEGEVVVLVDGGEAARVFGKDISLPKIDPGVHEIKIRSTANGKPAEASKTVKVDAGIHELELSF